MITAGGVLRAHNGSVCKRIADTLRPKDEPSAAAQLLYREQGVRRALPLKSAS